MDTEADLVAAVADGDRAAFELLYRHYAPWLTARLRHRCADEALLDDPAARTTVALPVTQALRRGLRMALGLLAFGLFWGASAVLARLGVAAGAREAFPVGALAMEGAALASLALSLALLGLRHSAAGSGSVLAAPVLILLLATALLLPDRSALLPAPGASNGGAASLRWGTLLVLALCFSGWELRERRTVHRGKGVRRT
ncbi:hypothetical protein [Streptomyces sp. NPDC048411]|uniref:RNA polymerase sigma factor n=1 Tax=Streptomyces sp. NPDC048411 TaxID=3157206 RepID=UPI003452585F